MIAQYGKGISGSLIRPLKGERAGQEKPETNGY
jgi:hypothetical protein